MHKISIFIICLIAILSCSAQEKKLLAGIRLQKSHNFYFENGFAIDYSQKKYLNNNIYIGVCYYTSRLGSAIQSNAIKQDNYLLQISYHFRKDKIICPVMQINTGYFHASYGSKMFDVLPNSSMLFSVEPGIFINLKYPIKSKISFGYNVITGNGTNGPGTLFPLYFQCSIFYQINIKKVE